MFTCIQVSTDKEINADEALVLANQGINLTGDLVDKFFGIPVFLKRSHFRKGKYGVRSHFCLKPGAMPEVFPEDCHFDGDYFSGTPEKFKYSESIEHINGKLFIATEGAKELYGDDFDPLAKYEHTVKLETGKRRIIDVALMTPEGSMEAHEVQLCSITPDELEARTLDYEDAYISVVWWFGKSANTQPNRDWYYQRFGEVAPILTFTESRECYSIDNFDDCDKFRGERTRDDGDPGDSPE